MTQNENPSPRPGIEHASDTACDILENAVGRVGVCGSTNLTRLVVNHGYDKQRFLAFLQHWIELKAETGLTSNP
jgi:hypothetical protein